MPERTAPCPDCGQPSSEQFGQNAMGWFLSRRCAACGDAEEADGVGPPLSDELRAITIAEEGEWTLSATAGLSVAALKALREQRSLSLAELRAIALNGQIARGTRYEVTGLRDAIARSDPQAAIVVRRADETPP